MSKHPNNYGTIYRIKDPSRKRPWVVRVPYTYFNEEGEKITEQKYIGYYTEQQDAINALAEYNRTRGTISVSPTITLYELWERWLVNNEDSIKGNTLKHYKVSFKKCAPLYDTKVRDLNYENLTKFFYDLVDKDCSFDTITAVRKVLSFLLDYANLLDVVNKNNLKKVDFKKIKKLADLNKSPQDTEEKRIPFSYDEIKTIEDYIDENFDETIKDSRLIIFELLQVYLYTGARTSEILNLKKQDCHLNEDIPYFDITDAKTENGIRSVPIHPSILRIFKKHYDEVKDPSYSLFRTISDLPISYDNFNKLYKRTTKYKNLNPEKDPYSTRHTFVTWFETKDEFYKESVFNAIIGHSQRTLAQKIYTHITIEDMYNMIQRLDYSKE